MKHKKVRTTLNHIEHFFILVSGVPGCISFSSFAYLHGIPIGISVSLELKTFAIKTVIKKYKSIIKKTKKIMI